MSLQFKNTKNLVSLGQWLKDGNAVSVGLNVIFERTLQKHQEGYIKDFYLAFTKFDYLTMCRLCENTCTLHLTDGSEVEKVPFSMLYVKFA